MESKPITECGMRLCNLVASWTAESPDAARDLLLRAFILYSSRIENQEAFLDALYGHEAWQEAQYCHSNEGESSSEGLLSSIREAICANIRRNAVRLQELVVALELSKNETVLGNILNSAEDAWIKKTDIIMQ